MITPLPDNAIRNNTAYQLFNRLPRAVLEWVTIASLITILVVLPILGIWAPDMFLAAVLAFAGLVYGLKGYENISYSKQEVRIDASNK